MRIRKLPYANSVLAKYLERKIKSIKSKTEEEIAADVGYSFASPLSRFYTGESAVPFDLIPFLARAINAVPIHIVRMAIDQHFPDVQEHLADYFGALATPGEYMLLRRWRAATENMDPATTSEADVIIDRAFREVNALLAVRGRTA